MNKKNQLTGNDLKNWVDSNDLLFQMSSVQSNVIVSTLEKNNYHLIIKEGALYSVCSTNDKNIESPITIDDVVDLAAELNYEELNFAKSEMEPETFELKEYCGKLKKLLNLQYESTVLESAFENTIYAKKMNEMLSQKVETNTESKQLKRNQR